MMLIALAGVLYAIRALNTGDVADKLSDPQSALGLLIGSDYRPYNWCPEKVVKVEMEDTEGKEREFAIITKSLAGAGVQTV